MNRSDCVPEKALVPLDAAQRTALAGLVQAERDSALRWWTMLNEMRCRGQLPDWVKKQMVGTIGDHERWTDACTEVNQALFGKVRHIHLEGEPERVEVWVGDVLFELTQRHAPKPGAGDAEVLTHVSEKVRQHLSGDIALVSTNERKPS